MRTPLRYPGGKARAIPIISKFIPGNTKTLYSSFLGGGAVELYCVSKGIEVYAFDKFKPLVEFWQCLLDNPVKLAGIVDTYYPVAKAKFYELKKTYANFKSKYERAAVFFVLNRTSFSGTTLTGGMSPDKRLFTPSTIERVRNFKAENMHVSYADFHESIPKANGNLMYLDPPYLVESVLYGHKGNMHKNFDHEGLAKLCYKYDNWILSYNDCEKIHEWYGDFEMHYPKWTYGMPTDRRSKEVLILSRTVSKQFQKKRIDSYF